jgi:predicted amidophosphoribosyltransferase
MGLIKKAWDHDVAKLKRTVGLKKKCPDCREDIDAKASVCPHCRYRFAK